MPNHFCPPSFLKQAGQSLVEILVAITIALVIILVLVSGGKQISLGQAQSDQRLQAELLAAEGMEIVYNLSTNTSNWATNFSKHYYSDMEAAQDAKVKYFMILEDFTLLEVPSGNEEDFTDLGNGYKRQIRLEPLKRNSNGDPDNSGTPDVAVTEGYIRTFKATSVVRWKQNGVAQQAEFVTYLVNLQ